MREILFKAKRIDNGEWVEGLLFLTQDNAYIAYTSQFDDDLFLSPQNIFISVDIETICQYTGLTDKNGNKIWENDIVWVTDDEGSTGMVDTGLGEIDFLEGLWYISGSVQNSLYDINKCFQIEVIGNIFDNPELLK